MLRAKEPSSKKSSPEQNTYQATVRPETGSQKNARNHNSEQRSAQQRATSAADVESAMERSKVASFTVGSLLRSWHPSLQLVTSPAVNIVICSVSRPQQEQRSREIQQPINLCSEQQ
ncbi:hypothetical protein FF1_046748 [Malus domestica]